MLENVITETKEVYIPSYDNVILEPIRKSNDGGIEIPVKAQDKVLTRAMVIAVGPGKYDLDNQRYFPTNAKPGDTVFINSMMGAKLKLGRGKEFIVMRDDEIRVVLGAENV